MVGGDWLNPFGHIMPGPAEGDCMIVTEVSHSALTDSTMLHFRLWSPTRFSARNFRKIVPVADQARAADAAFLSSLKLARRSAPAPRRETEDA